MITSSDHSFASYLFAWVFLAMGWIGSAQAGYNEYFAVTTNGPTYDRMAFNCTVSTHDGVNYHLQPFTVSADGSYVIHSRQIGGWDGAIFVYEVGFDPSDPVVNCLIGNDDVFGENGSSELTISLVAGTEYLLVTTAYDAPDSGAFENTFSGPGEIVLGVRYSGSLGVLEPIFDLPYTDCSGTFDVAPYLKQPFVVDADGVYHFTSVQTLNGSSFNGSLVLYTGAFNDSQPLSECTIADLIGFNGGYTSSISAQLYAGAQYVLVTAGYTAAELGSFANTIAGPGHVALGGIVYSGAAVSDPSLPIPNSFARPDEACGPTTTVVYYSAQRFYGSANSSGADNYRMGSTQDYDGYLHLYQDFFDPANPTQDCIVGNDDAPPGIGTSLIPNTPNGAPLAYDTNYLVTSSFEFFETGHFVNYIAPPPGEFVALGNETFIYAGSTTGGFSINRPNAGNGCQTYSGQMVPYHAFQFWVDQSGNYRLYSAQEPGFDGYLLLYDAPFIAANPAENCLGGNDDGPAGIGSSAFIAAPLKAYRTYMLVTTGYSPSDHGNFNNTISGPGSVIQPGDLIFANGFEGP